MLLSIAEDSCYQGNLYTCSSLDKQWSLLMESAYNLSRQHIPIPGTSRIDSHNNNSRALIGRADPDCAGKTGPNGVICCQTDNDCPPTNYTKGKCKSPSGTGGTPYDYACVWPPCKTNPECVPGACCTADPSIPSVDRAQEGSCVLNGTIYKSKYLCDPPEWNNNQNTSTNKPKTQNIFDSILSFFSYFFQR